MRVQRTQIKFNLNDIIIIITIIIIIDIIIINISVFICSILYYTMDQHSQNSGY